MLKSSLNLLVIHFWKSFSNPKLIRVAGLSFKNVKHCQTKFYILSSFTYTLIPYSSFLTSWQVTWSSRLCGNIVLKKEGPFSSALFKVFARFTQQCSTLWGKIIFEAAYHTRAIITCSWLETALTEFSEELLDNNEIVSKNGITNIQATSYNGTHTVYNSNLLNFQITILFVSSKEFELRKKMRAGSSILRRSQKFIQKIDALVKFS